MYECAWEEKNNIMYSKKNTNNFFKKQFQIIFTFYFFSLLWTIGHTENLNLQETDYRISFRCFVLPIHNLYNIKHVYLIL